MRSLIQSVYSKRLHRQEGRLAYREVQCCFPSEESVQDVPAFEYMGLILIRESRLSHRGNVFLPVSISRAYIRKKDNREDHKYLPCKDKLPDNPLRRAYKTSLSMHRKS